MFQTDPSKWSVDEVCRWLELIGLGAFRQAFRGTYIDTCDLRLRDLIDFLDCRERSEWSIATTD